MSKQLLYFDSDESKFEIKFRNFVGETSEYNREGKRNFVVEFYDTELAEQLMREGWNVKPKGTEDDPKFYLPVEVRFDRIPPKIEMVTGRKVTQITEETIKAIQSADFEKVDLAISPSYWEDKEGNPKVKAYLSHMVCFLLEDKLDKKFAYLRDEDEDDEIPF